MKEESSQQEQILEMAAGFMPGCVIGAAAELDLWTVLGDGSATADDLAGRLGADRRATAVLLDAAVALKLLKKDGDRYLVPVELKPLLSRGSAENILPGLRLRMNVLRGWSQLAWVVKAGIACPRHASIRGPAADREAFIAAMHVFSRPIADELVAKLGPPEFALLLDVGGASGTTTFADLLPADFPPPDETLSNFETRQAVQNIVGNMPDNLRMVLVLSYFHGFAYKDIAEILEVPLGTLKSRLHAAVKHFARQWKAATERSDNDRETE